LAQITRSSDAEGSIPGWQNQCSDCKSGTGKSSLLHIIDYCLGSGKCSIPVGKIRQHVAWFGVHLKLESGEAIVGRRNPEGKEQTGDIFWLEGAELDPVGLVPEKNSNTDELKRRFNEMAGLSNLDLDPRNTTSNFKSAASFRDMAAFNFQPQHIVANPHAMFFKADSFEHREKLKNVFPLVLGAVTPAQLVAKHELFNLENEIKRLELELRQRTEAVNRWVSEIRGVYVRAQELGLLPNSPSPTEGWEAARYVSILRGVSSSVDALQRTDLGSAEVALGRVRELEEEEAKLSREIGDRKRSLLRVQRLASSITSYSKELDTQSDKLFAVDWFAQVIKDGTRCPFCESDNERAREQVGRLQEMGRELHEVTSTTLESAPILDREVMTLSRDIRMLEEQLQLVRDEKWQLEDKSTELSERTRTLNAAYRFVGRVEQAIEGYWQIQEDGDLRNRVANLQREATRLKRLADPQRERAALESALTRFSQIVSHYVDVLKLERAGDPVQLVVVDLMIGVLSKEGRRDALWEIGSAENWMGYHVATVLALQELFLQNVNNPVPTFLVLDQPSQAYFPDQWPGDEVPTDQRPKPDESTPQLVHRSDDIAGVHRVFEALSLALERTKGQLQIIVTDHAGEITWRGLDTVHLVGNWRPGQDDYLIPREWLEARDAV
jgi:hypothetical protein